MTKYGEKPTYLNYEILGQYILNNEFAPRITLHMERVDYVTVDDMVNFGEPSYKDFYWKIKKTLNRPKPKSDNSSILFQT